MKLNLCEIKSITFGAVSIKEIDGAIEFNRFNDKQIECYYDKSYRGISLRGKMHHTSGVRFSFLTTSKRLKMEYVLECSSGRNYAYFDVLENGILIAHFGKEDIISEQNKTHSHEIEFKDGEKHVEVYFPWSARTRIVSLELDDFSLVIPKKREKTMISYGDSITQGYDAEYSSNTLYNRLSRYFNCDIYNKGVGGDTFSPKLLQLKEDISPDIVTISYGSNDWFLLSKEDIIKNCNNFLLSAFDIYKNSKIYLTTPIWRADYQKKKEITLKEIAELINDISKDRKGVKVITGWDLVPHSEDYFVSDGLHPNDKGFEEYYNNYIKNL